MYFKVNLKKLDNYSQVIAENLTKEFYQYKATVSGQEVLKFTPLEQINLFAIFHVFESWKDGVEKLKSPYFNYDHPKVQDAFTKYVNLLSQNISIEKDLFKPLLRKSIFETLYWIVAPEDFINYQYINGKLSTVDKVKTFGKYVRINKILIDELAAILVKQQKEKFPQDELVWHFSKIFEANQIAIHDPQHLLEEFSLKMNFEVNDLIPGSQVKLSFSDTIITPPKIEPEEEMKSKNGHHQDTIVSKEINTNKSDNSTSDNPGNEFSKSQAKDKEKKSFPHTINQNFKPAITINESITQEDNTLNKKLGRTKVADIRVAIPLNKKFQFINELFNGETSEYNNDLSEIELSPNYNHAVKILQEKYAQKFNWRIETPSVEDFFDLVERKFI